MNTDSPSDLSHLMTDLRHSVAGLYTTNAPLEEATASRTTMVMIPDEMHCYWGGQNDSLKEDLREIDGVPNATYQVKDGQVFVFDKLVQLVQQNRSLKSEMPLAELARGLIPEATISALDAIQTWGVIPEPFELVENPSSGLMIRHRPFNARLPGVFQSKEDAQEVLANLLLGNIQPGNGDFSYRGQRMTLCDPLDATLLPPRPLISRAGELKCPGYSALKTVSYASGFEPVSEVFFDGMKERHSAWADDIAWVGQHARAYAADVWKRTTTLRLETLSDTREEVPEHGQQEFAELRVLYPELSMLSDGSLYAWFDAYQIECCYLNGWTAERDDAFLFYLLGKVVGRENERDAAKDVGQWTAYALLRGDSLDAAFAFGRSALAYDIAISVMARRIADAVKFLAMNKQAPDLRGPAITTLRDFYQQARSVGLKVNITPVLAGQNTADFGVEVFANKGM
jgi:hypothetical protein